MATDNLDPNATQPQKRKRSRRAKVSVELNKYKTLIDALGDRHKVKRVVMTIFALGLLLFIGISAITVAIKRLYPYSDITTNGLGATTIKSEKNEVSYWLFNTATLWANSGIHVNKGDIITIRASGKSHTAIHHIIDNASNNLKDSHSNWVGSEGEIEEKASERDKIRRKYRLMPDQPAEALLMQIAPNDNLAYTPEEGNPENFYFIGKERQHIYINSDGTLHFAVNDIVLNRPTIAKMMWENIQEKHKEEGYKAMIDTLLTKHKIEETYWRTIDNDFPPIPKKYKGQEKDNYYDTIKDLFNEVFKQNVDSAQQVYTFLNPSHFSSEQSFSEAANTMCTIIRKECKNGTIKDILYNHWTQPEDSVRYNSFIDKICDDTNFSTNSIEELDTIKAIFDALRIIKKEDILPTIGKMKLGYTRKDDNTLECELSYYYGKDQDDNDKRKAVWFEDNIGSFLIVIEKTK